MRRVSILLIASIVASVALFGEVLAAGKLEEEVIVVRKFEPQRDQSVSLTVDRVDYNQKGMNFTIPGDAGAKIYDFIKSNVGRKIKVYYTSDMDCPFCISRAEPVGKTK